MDLVHQAWEWIAFSLSTLVIVSTALVRMPFLQKYTVKATAFAKFVDALLKFLPTVGKNPKTKELEEKVKDVFEKK